MPLLGPPLYTAYVCICSSHMPANSTAGLWGSSVSPEHPVFSSTNNTRVHVLPPSVDLYTPSPITSASRMAHASPVPAQTILGSDGATASAPMACTGSLSNTGPKLWPPSTDFHTPPDAEPRYQTAVSPGTPLIEA